MAEQHVLISRQHITTTVDSSSNGYLQFEGWFLLKGEVSRLKRNFAKSSALHQLVERLSNLVSILRIPKEMESDLGRRSA